MTNEVAIKCIEDLQKSFGVYANDEDIKELSVALDMAIKAIQAVGNIQTLCEIPISMNDFYVDVSNFIDEYLYDTKQAWKEDRADDK